MNKIRLQTKKNSAKFLYNLIFFYDQNLHDIRTRRYQRHVFKRTLHQTGLKNNQSTAFRILTVTLQYQNRIHQVAFRSVPQNPPRILLNLRDYEEDAFEERSK